ncbi:MAG: hypothetical protein R3F11_30020 [Verrucomicrobiales bacterium]
MKLLASFLFGAIAGAGLLFLIRDHLAPTPPPATAEASAPSDDLRAAQAQVARLTDEVARLQAEAAAAAEMAKAGGDQGEVAVVQRKEGPKVAKFETLGIDQNIQEQMQKARQRRIEARVKARLATLTDRLGLSDEQAAKVRDILTAQYGGSGGSGDLAFDILGAVGDGDAGAIAGAVLGGGGSKADRNAAADAALAELLDPAQQEKYAAFQAEERANQIEARANEELARLQRQFTLSPDQKDRAFEIFANQATEDLDHPVSLADGDAYAARQQERHNALGEVLSEEQLASYRSTPRVITTFDGFSGGGFLDGGGAASIVIEATDIDVNAGAPEPTPNAPE